MGGLPSPAPLATPRMLCADACVRGIQWEQSCFSVAASVRTARVLASVLTRSIRGQTCPAVSQTLTLCLSLVLSLRLLVTSPLDLSGKGVRKNGKVWLAWGWEETHFEHRLFHFVWDKADSWVTLNPVVRPLLLNTQLNLRQEVRRKKEK